MSGKLEPERRRWRKGAGMARSPRTPQAGQQGFLPSGLMRHFSRPGSCQAGFVFFPQSVSHFAMKTRIPCLLLIGLSLAAAGTLAHGQSIVLRCGAQGQHSTETDGYFINSQGEVVFSESSIHCGEGGGGGPMPTIPSTLSSEFTSAPTPGQITELPATVSFTAQIHNFDHQSIFFNDACAVTARSPSNQAIATLNLQPSVSTGLASGNLSFPSGLANGNYNVTLACNRSFQGGQQQAVVNNPAPQMVVVNVESGGGGVTPPSECPPIDPVFQPRTHYNYVDTYVGGTVGGGWSNGLENFGPGQGTSWRYWQYQKPSTTKIQLRYWTFVPTENTRMRLEMGSAALALNAISISECPGQFTTDQSKCSQPTHLSWATGNRTHPTATCNLEAGKTYYINNALFNQTIYQQTGQYVVPDCSETACTVQYRAAVE